MKKILAALVLGLGVASIGVLVMAVLVWIIYRSQLKGRGAIEYLAMFPQAVPRLVFAFGMMWAWLVFPLPVYGTMWVLLIAYLTVFMPLGVRTGSETWPGCNCAATGYCGDPTGGWWCDNGACNNVSCDKDKEDKCGSPYESKKCCEKAGGYWYCSEGCYCEVGE